MSRPSEAKTSRRRARKLKGRRSRKRGSYEGVHIPLDVAEARAKQRKAEHQDSVGRRILGRTLRDVDR